MTAYYNEIDPYAAQWLRNLIAAGHIAPGDVDERSIEDVRPDDLRGYTQCHFFAGIGVWSYALRLAGWSDDRPIWTGSCPCQPFSTAGKGGGFADERHLWPAWEWLIGQCRPTTVLGEQVASKDGLGWLDLVSSDLEGQGYAFGALDTCSAGHGAPHIRQRLRFAAHDLRSAASGLQHAPLNGRLERRAEPSERGVVSGRGADRLAEFECIGRATVQCAGRGDVGSGRDSERARAGLRFGSSTGGLADAERGAAERHGYEVGSPAAGMQGASRQQRLRPDAGDGEPTDQPRPTNGHWRDADWLLCRDERWRPVEPGTFPLAHGATARVGRLRAYGNAVDAQATKAFVEAVMESIDR